MNEINIHINWEYFLGIMATLIGLAWYASAKFSKIKTSIDWIRDSLNTLRRDVNEIRSDVDILKKHIK